MDGKYGVAGLCEMRPKKVQGMEALLGVETRVHDEPLKPGRQGPHEGPLEQGWRCCCRHEVDEGHEADGRSERFEMEGPSEEILSAIVKEEML